MATLPSAPPSERRVSIVDQFCTQTYDAGELEARHFRGIASTLGAVCMMLLACLAFSVWRAEAIERERDLLLQQLDSERAARIRANLAVKDVEMGVANYALDTRVRRDIVDERMLEQDQRSAELAQLAQQVERQKLIAADCVTPRSILVAAGL